MILADTTESTPREQGLHASRVRCRRALRARLAATVVGICGCLAGGQALGQVSEPAASALPAGGEVGAGAASIDYGTAAVVIRQQTSKAAINWRTFDIGRDAEVHIEQPDKSSILLNRVLSADPSRIFGKITANGQVVLTNPFGIYFGVDARVDVGGITATTHSIGDSDFMSGKMRFARAGSTGTILNQGSIASLDGGYVALLAPEVRNEGLITARLGTVALASGEGFELQFDPDSRLIGIHAEASEVAALVENRRAILAPGGTIILTATSFEKLLGGVVRNSGEVAATGLEQRSGRILLTASQGVANDGTIVVDQAASAGDAGGIEVASGWFSNTGSLSAAGGNGYVSAVADSFTQTASGRVALAGWQGGKFSLVASRTVALDGTIDVSSYPTSPSARGGEVRLAARQSIDLGNVTLDASGPTGGTILITAGHAAVTEFADVGLLPRDATAANLRIYGSASLIANGVRGAGGNVTLLSDQIELADRSRVSVTGETRGGSILVGGDWQGAAGLYQASRVRVADDVTLDASALASGGGGKIVVWSRLDAPLGHTEVKGRLIADGGRENGSGGAIETSGARLDVAGASVSANSRNGKAGLWLLDPYDYTIDEPAAATIASALSSTNVTVTTSSNVPSYGSSGLVSDSGNIAVTAALSWSANTTLSLNAANGIVVTADIANSGSTSGLTFNAGLSGQGGISGTGTLTNRGVLTFNVAASGGDGTYTGDIRGTGNVLKLGDGALTLAGNNTFTGNLKAGYGRLRAGSTTAFGNLAGTEVGITGILDLNGYANSVGTLYGGYSTGSITNSGVTDATLTIHQLTANTYLGSFQDGPTNRLSVIKEGGGALTLRGNSTHSGTTTVSAGLVYLGNGGSTGSLGTGAVINNAALVINRSDDALVVPGPISGAGSVTLVGPGTVTLSGANTYTGGTVLSGGTLRLGSTGAVGSTGVLSFSGGTLQYSAANTTDYSARVSALSGSPIRIDTNGQTITFASAIGSSAALAKLGAGTLILTGANTYSGGTTIADGTLQVGNGGTRGAIGLASVTNDGILVFNNSGTLSVNNTISGSGRLTQAGSGLLILSGTNTYTGGTSLEGGTLRLASAGALSTSGAISFTGGTLQYSSGNSEDYSARFAGSDNQAIRIDTNGLNRTLAGSLAGSGASLTKLGGGTLTLTGNNTYTGATTISAGTVAVGAGGSAGTVGPGDIINNGAITFNRSDDLSISNAISGTGNLTKTGAGTVTLTALNTYSGTTTITAGTLQIGDGGTTGTLGSGPVANANNAVLAINRSDTVTLANPISGNGGLTQAGSGTTVLSGANTYNGPTIVSAGTLKAGSATAFGTNSATTIATGAVLELNGLSNAIGSLNGAGTLNNEGAAAGLSINQVFASTFSGTIQNTGGALSLTKLGSSTLTLAGNNTYSGTTTISAGTLDIGSGGTSGTLGTGAVTNNSALRFNRSDAMTVASAIGGTGSVNKRGTGTVVFTGTNNYTGTTTVSGGTLQIGDGGTNGALGSGAVILTTTGIVRVNRSDTINLANDITDVSGTGGLIQAGTGTTILSGNNAYVGPTLVQAGTLKAGSSTAFSANSATTIESGATLELAGWANAIGSLSGAGTINNESLNGAVLTINQVVGRTFSGKIQNTGSPLSFVKAGSGILTLTGSNSYTGATTVAAGTLSLGSGSALGSSEAISFSGGTLQYSAANRVDYSNRLSNAPGQQVRIDTNGQTITFQSGIVSAGGTLTKLGSGTLILAGDNSYSGATLISAGTLQVGNGGTSGTLGQGAVTNNGALVVSRSNDVPITNPITGSGSLNQAGTGTLVLTGTNAYTGGTVINSGVLSLGSASALGDTGIIRFGGGTLQYSAGNTRDYSARLSPVNQIIRIDTNGQAVTFASPILGAGSSLIKSGEGSLTLTAASAYGGGTTISAGSLVLTGAGAVGVGNVFNSGTFVLDNAGPVTFANTILGTGALVKRGSHTLILTGNNLYSGNTVVERGSLHVGNGGTSGSIGAGQTLTIAEGATVAFNRADDRTVRQAIGGIGSVIVTGGGTLTLTENGSYTGVTEVAGYSTLVLRNDAPTTSSASFIGSGRLIIEPTSPNFSGSLDTASFKIGRDFLSLRIGKDGNQAPVIISRDLSIAGSIDIIGGQIALNALLEAGNDNAIYLTSGGIINSGPDGSVSANRLWIWGTDVSLTNPANNVGALGYFTNSIDFFSNRDLIVGDSDYFGSLAEGKIRIASAANLYLAGSVYTFESSTDAVVLTAGQGRLAGDGTGGNILIGPDVSIITGDGGTALLFSGNVASSTGLTELVGYGSGRFRYGATDALRFRSGSRAPLTGGIYAVYRESPIARFDPLAMTYGDSLPALAAQGLVNGDNVTYDIVGRVDSSSGNVRANPNPYPLTLNLSDLGYTIPTSNLTLSVAQRSLTGATIAASRSTYGSALAPGAVRFDNVASGDEVAASARVDIGATSSGGRFVAGGYTQSAGAALSGVDASNYSFAGTTTPGANYTIDPMAILSITGLRAKSKVYDGTTAASIDIADAKLVDLLPDDQVRLASATGNFDDKNVGYGKAVKLSEIRLSGADADNYSLGSSIFFTSGDIAAKPVSVIGVASASKVYDGTAAAEVIGIPSLARARLGSATPGDGLAYEGDELVLAGTLEASFNSKNVTEASSVSFSGLRLAGADAINYALQQISPDSRARITPRMISISGSKVFDGTSDMTGFVILNTGVGEELITYTDAVSAGIEPQAQNNFVKSITLTDGPDGALASNYMLPLLSPVTAPVTILPAPTSIIADATATAQASTLLPAKPLNSSVSVTKSLLSDAATAVSIVLPSGPTAAATGFSIALPIEVRTLLDGGQLVATLSDGSPLPAWLTFDRSRFALHSTSVPVDGYPLEIVITNGERSIRVLLSQAN